MRHKSVHLVAELPQLKNTFLEADHLVASTKRFVTHNQHSHQQRVHCEPYWQHCNQINCSVRNCNSVFTCQGVYTHCSGNLET